MLVMSVRFMICCFFPNVIKTLRHGFDPNITFNLRWKSSILLGVCAHAMQRSLVLRSAFTGAERRDIDEDGSALI